MMAAPYRALLAAVALYAAFHAGRYYQASARPFPALIGYGCEGASGPIMASEESDFPICQAIERN